MTQHSDSHTHACARCGRPFECDGEWVAREDEDGFMIPRCTAFHIQQDDHCTRCLADDAEPSDFDVAETMQRCGGTFFRLIGTAAHHADPVNLAKLKTVFADDWAAYRRLTEQRLARQAKADA